MAALNTIGVETEKTRIVLVALRNIVIKMQKVRNRVGRPGHHTNHYKQNVFVKFLLVAKNP